MGEQEAGTMVLTAAAGAEVKVLSPGQHRQLEQFGRRINRLGANFAVLTPEGRALVLCEDGGFKSPRRYLADLARQVTEEHADDSPESTAILRFVGPTTVLAGHLDLVVTGQTHFKGKAVAFVDLGDGALQAGPNGRGVAGGCADLPTRRLYLTEMLASLIECFHSVSKAERQMDMIGTELAHVYEELVLLHELSTNMKLTESDGGFLQMACDSLNEVVPVEGMAILLDRWVGNEQKLMVVAGSGLVDWDEPSAGMLYSRLITEIRAGKEALLDSDVFSVFKYQWPASIRNLIAVPLLGKDPGGGPAKENGERSVRPVDRTAPVLGVMVAINSLSKRDFDSTDVKLFNSVASGCATFVENGRLFGDLKDLFLGLLRALARSIDAKDGYTHGHSERVAFISRWIAERLAAQHALRSEQIHEVYFAGLMHDIGKIGVDDWVLRKTTPLTEPERDCIRKHPDIGASILRGIKQMRDIVPAVLSHHERIDGGGYPNGLRGDQIPLIARIVCLADSFDAMTSRRSYRDARTLDQAIEEIRAHSGTQFDAGVAQAFLDSDVRRLWEILQDGGSDVYYTGDVTDYATVAVGALVR
jgi:HD-GYP domain-containing protein (c-di-GMP phosphodiesterase class II)